jgi:hypothetical protein
MLHTYEALLQPDGRLQFLDPPVGEIQQVRRVLVTFTEAPPLPEAVCGASLSEPVLAEDWLRDEEEAAWAHLQPGK